MKALLASLLLIPLVAAEPPLAHTRWVAADATRCPDTLYFGVKRYLFVNRCRTARPDGIVERGRYVLDGERIVLTERSRDGPGLAAIPPEVSELGVVEVSADRLALRVGERVLRFRRGGGAALLQVRGE